MNNVHDDAPVVFQTRWALSYLRGPLTREQIKTLMDPVRREVRRRHGIEQQRRSHRQAVGCERPTRPHAPQLQRRQAASSNRPVVPAGDSAKSFVAINERVPDGYQLEYRPGLLGKGKVHFVRKADGIDVWRECFVLQIDPRHAARRHLGRRDPSSARLRPRDDEPDDRGQFADLPSELARDKSYPIFARQLKDHLYREESLKLLASATRSTKLRKPDEDGSRFSHPTGAAARRRGCTPSAKKLKKSIRSRSSAEVDDTHPPRQARAQHAALAVLRPARQHAVGRRRHGHERDGQKLARPPPLARSRHSARSPPRRGQQSNAQSQLRTARYRKSSGSSKHAPGQS